MISKRLFSLRSFPGCHKPGGKAQGFNSQELNVVKRTRRKDNVQQTQRYETGFLNRSHPEQQPEGPGIDL
jgi:hypothetical protein